MPNGGPQLRPAGQTLDLTSYSGVAERKQVPIGVTESVGVLHGRESGQLQSMGGGLQLIGNRFPWGNVITESQANYNANPATYYYDFSTYSGYNRNFSSGQSLFGGCRPNGTEQWERPGDARRQLG